MKNKIILLFLIVACFIPSVVAYASYNNTQNAPVDDKTAVSISIDDINGKNFRYTREAEGDTADTLIDFFITAKKNATALASLPDTLQTEDYYKVTISSNVRDETYHYYFSSDPTTNYFRDPNGQAYKMAEADAEVFIKTEYAESLYEMSAMPNLTLSGTYSVTPDTAVWQYKNYTGEYVDSDVTGLVADTAERYELEGGLDLKFDMEPDYCRVYVTGADGSVIFDDMYGNMGDFRFDGLGQVTVDVVAKWYEDSSRTFCGELDYSFLSYVTAPAEFYLGMNTVDAGRFVTITATNVSIPENITYTSTMASTYKPTFYMEGDYAVALLPIDAETAAGLYTVTLSYGAVTKELTIAIENDGIKSSYYSIPAATVASTRNDTTLEAFEKAVGEIGAKASSTRMFSGSFAEPVNGWFQLLRGFGRDIYVNDATSPTYRNNGIDYNAGDGTDIIASNAGEVVYAGWLDYTGNIVVIEHGYGLKTWYYNLGSVSASVGDKVERGTVIGKAGSTGFTGISGVHFAMSVGDRFVSPYDTFDWTDSTGKVVIAKIDE
ncbi:MAG: M23 family metallopeptidase [Clostridia bacterium]|nr:M23 family metallopeptidase [Clostridia bacterium]